MVFWDHALANSGGFSTRPLSILRRAAGRGGVWQGKRSWASKGRTSQSGRSFGTLEVVFFEIWWTRGDSNPRPPHCERGKIPAELLAQSPFANHIVHQPLTGFQLGPLGP